MQETCDYVMRVSGEGGGRGGGGEKLELSVNCESSALLVPKLDYQCVL